MKLSALNIAILAFTLTLTTSAAVFPYKNGDTSGCGKQHDLIDFIVPRRLKSSGKDRSYRAHLPADYKENQRYPLIVGFHASSSVGFFLEVDTGLDSASAPALGDKIVLYPNGLGGAWAGASYSKATVAEDLQFVWDVLSDARRTLCVDSARVYATGMSSGGGFVDVIACNATVGGEFAAFAPVAGAYYRNNEANHAECRPARVPTPVLEFHGGADTSVRYEGGKGEGGVEPSIPNWLAWWAERNECDTPYKQEDLYDGDVHHLSWTCKGQQGVLQHYKTDSQKHDWPSSELNFSQIAALDEPTYLNASILIQEFFAKYTRPAEACAV